MSTIDEYMIYCICTRGEMGCPPPVLCSAALNTIMGLTSWEVIDPAVILSMMPGYQSQFENLQLEKDLGT